MSWLKELTAKEFNPNAINAAVAAALKDKAKMQAFDVTENNVNEVINRRYQLLQSVYTGCQEFGDTKLKISSQQTLEYLWHLWLPLAIKIESQYKKLKRPFIQGFLGSQGTGKTTLCAVVSLILKHLGYQILSLSIDDLYKTYSERLELQNKDPRLIWRGPPGTHDVNLGLSLIEKILQRQTPIEVPRFDKSAYDGAGDRYANSEIIHSVDIVLFEGWFVGAQPINLDVLNSRLNTGLSPIITQADKNFARDINANLIEYLPLWEKLDSLIILYPVDYHLSLEWRKQAEHEMIASGKRGMSDVEIEQFVNYFWRSLHPELFITPLTKLPNLVDLVIEVQANHSFGRIYQPLPKSSVNL
ncbi:MAG: glycerate kinase [Cyanobacteria bacterium P01_A01_bin.84]